MNSFFEMLNKIMPETITKKISAKGLLGIIAVFAVAVLVISNITGGYKSVVNKVFKSLINTDGKLYYSIMAEDYINDRIEYWNDTEEEIIEDYQSSVENQMNRIKSVCGDDVKITYKIEDTYHPTKEEVASLNRYIKDYGFEENTLQDAMVVYTSYTGEGSLAIAEYEKTILVIKVRGKWCITGGYINLSWYSN